jgi:hypothetical protein
MVESTMSFEGCNLWHLWRSLLRGRLYLSRMFFLGRSCHVRPISRIPLTNFYSNSRHRFYTLIPARTAAKNTTTWVDRLPAKVRPYLYLTRIDKPIGTLLLFYPCGSYHKSSVCSSGSLIYKQHGPLQWHHMPSIYPLQSRLHIWACSALVP